MAIEIAQGDVRPSRATSEAIQTLFYSGNPDVIIANVKKITDQLPNYIDSLYQGHKAYLWAMDIDSARIVLPRILASKFPEVNKALAQLRQACAENRKKDALGFHDDVLENSDRLVPTWLAYRIIGDADAAVTLLAEYDEQRRYNELSALLHYGELDLTNLPNLSARLSGQGIEDRQVFDIPFRCER
jgi:hypothetical protein